MTMKINHCMKHDNFVWASTNGVPNCHISWNFIKITYIIVSSIAIFERDFAQQNAIKSDLRASLKSGTLDSSSLTGTSKQMIWSSSTLTLLMWSNKSSTFCILHEKLRRMKGMLEKKLLILLMLQRVFHASAIFLQLLMCAIWLSVKLKPMTDMAFLTHFLYSFNTLGSTLEDRISLDPFTTSQRFMDTNNILILSFQRLNFPPWNLSMILAASHLNDVIIHLDIYSKYSNNIYFILNALYSQISQVKSSTPRKLFKTSKWLKCLILGNH